MSIELVETNISVGHVHIRQTMHPPGALAKEQRKKSPATNSKCQLELKITFSLPVIFCSICIDVRGFESGFKDIPPQYNSSVYLTHTMQV